MAEQYNDAVQKLQSEKLREMFQKELNETQREDKAKLFSTSLIHAMERVKKENPIK